MASVPRIHSKPEVAFRKALFALGYRYRLHVRNIPGTPDIVFRRQRIAIFVHGCFWHRHPNCKLSSTPSAHREFWKEKFRANVRRDKRNITNLRALGWRPIIVWQCEIEQKFVRVLIQVADFINRHEARLLD